MNYLTVHESVTCWCRHRYSKTYLVIWPIVGYSVTGTHLDIKSFYIIIIIIIIITMIIIIIILKTLFKEKTTFDKTTSIYHVYLNIHLTVVVYDLLSSYGKQRANERTAFKFGIMYIHHMLTWYLCIYLVTRIKAVKQCVDRCLKVIQTETR